MHCKSMYWRNWTCTSYWGDVTFCLCRTSDNSKYFRHSLGLWDGEVDLYIFIQLMYNKNDHLAKWSIFVRWLMSSFAYRTASPLDPRRPLHMLYIYIMMFNCPKGILGLGGKASKNKLKYTSFIFSMTNITNLSIFRTHAQKEYCKVLETKGIYILNNLVLLLFENL